MIHNTSGNSNMNVDSADRTLRNVLEVCGKDTEVESLSSIRHHFKLKLLADNLWLIITFLCWIITLIIPVFLPHASSSLSTHSSLQTSLKVEWHRLDNDEFYISFSGGQVNPTRSYMEDDDGNIVRQSAYDSKANMISFPYDGKDYNIYIYDELGGCIHLLLARD